MKTKMLISSLVVLLFANGLCLADRQLDRSEILQILQTLTAEPHKTWIPAGTIVATHEEYKAAATNGTNAITAKINSSNEYRMTTNVTVRYGGEKFYWQIDVASRTESIKSDPNAANNVAAGQFDLNANGSRIFAWDGEKYSTYFRPTNNAIIKDAAKANVPHVVNGPLTAGFIPWGYGHYSYEKLSAATSWAVEMVTAGQKQIQLTLNHPNGSEMVFVTDPGRNYAVLSHSVTKADGSIAVNTYGNFLQIGGKWIPTTVMLEQYKNSVTPQNLAASDLWNFTSVDTNMPPEDSFKINYEADALVEYHNSITPKSVIYRYSKASPASKEIDTDELLIDKFDTDSAGSSLAQNCAAAAIKYAASKLGRNITNQQLAQLRPDSGENTSFYAMKQFVQSTGLYCRAVRTDLQTLKGLPNCQAILHIPGKNHYVVLANSDDKYVRTIDLTNRKFFDRLPIDEFGDEWSDGMAILISNQPINAQLLDIEEAALRNIVGKGYSCSRLLQQGEIFYCSAPIGGDCGGTYSQYFERWGCASAKSGTCGTSLLCKYMETICIVDPYSPTQCEVTGEWALHYMRACQ